MTAGDPHDGATGSDPAAEVLKLLGLARRAGKLEVGFSAVERMAHRRSDALVMVARDMGPSQRRQVDGWPGVKVLTLPLYMAEQMKRLALEAKNTEKPA